MTDTNHRTCRVTVAGGYPLTLDATAVEVPGEYPRVGALCALGYAATGFARAPRVWSTLSVTRWDVASAVMDMRQHFAAVGTGDATVRALHVVNELLGAHTASAVALLCTAPEAALALAVELRNA